LGIDLGLVSGSGARGRVHKADVLAFADEQGPAIEAGPAVAVPARAVPLPDAVRRQVVPLAGPRKIIADRMAYSASSAPHITLSLRVDMSEAARLRDRAQDAIQDKTGYRLSYTAIIARAVAWVLPQHPYLNASLQGDEIILWEDVHLGVATSLEDYLIVPVIRDAQAKNLEQVVTALGDLVERARARRLTPAEMSGSTFTISNLGMFGIESFTAIINPPEVAILAVGAIVDTMLPSQEGGKLRPVMNLTLSADHRVVDGAAAARFLAELKATLENPYLLI
jgi:pyruvate dehydrogenase E2 component (dihydrolipoamide acetyltransferase)